MISIRNIESASVGIVLLLCACDDIPVSPPIAPSSEQTLVELVAYPKGITMAVGDTVQLSVDGINLLGEVIPRVAHDSGSLAPFVFRASDVTRLQVSTTGELIAKGSGSSPIRVFVSWSYRGVTRADTVYVKINATRPPVPVASISIHPLQGDSVILGYGAQKDIRVQAYTQDSVSVAGVYAYLDTDRRRRRIKPDDINPTNGRLTVQQKGVFWVYAQSLVYGKFLRDSVQWRGTNPVTVAFTDNNNGLTQVGIVYPALFLAPCGRVTITNGSDLIFSQYSRTLIVTLDEPDAIGICRPEDVTTDYGTILAGQSAVRAFPRAGTVTLRFYEAGDPPRLLYVRKITVE